MIKQAPSPSRLVLMLVFALSCFGIMLFLWTSFGGPTPLAPKGYRYYADFAEATQLADHAEVRLSGVPVGSVVKSEPHGTVTRATIEIDHQYAPIPRDSKAVLRAKTLLGETYMEITPGTATTEKLAENAVLPAGQVEATTELDEVLRALDPKTRKDLQKLLVGLSHGLRGRGEDMNQAFGNISATAEDATDVLRVLDTQHRAVQRLVRDTGEVLDAVSRRQGRLRSLVTAGQRVTATTARRDEHLTEAIRILPTTLRELRPTMDAVTGMSADAAPVIRDLRPGGREFAPALRAAVKLSPEVRGLFGDIDRLADAARDGLPAATRIVNATRPVFQILDPVLREALPVVQYLSLFRGDLIAPFTNLSSATQASDKFSPDKEPLHYLRVVAPFMAEGFQGWDRRLTTNRHNPYLAPEGMRKLKDGVESFDCENVKNGIPNAEGAPPCKVQAPLDFQGKKLAYPHVEADSGP